jgi:hypothetical protein
MEYQGKYPFFPFDKITTYPIKERKNKVKQEDLYFPDRVMDMKPEFEHPDLDTIADAIVEARTKNQPVIWLMGAHPIKAGMSPLIIDLMQRGISTLLCGNFASAIHDFEIALIGETSEVVPNALPRGEFGMSRETGIYINDAIKWGNERKLGLGETLGRVIAGEASNELDMEFPFKHESYLAQGYLKNIPVTIHATMGTDITDQHPNFDGESKGGCSGRDFGVFAGHIRKFNERGGGCYLNVGSAVTGPEVILKAVSMAANIGEPPMNLITADFDIRPANLDHMTNEHKHSYYYRDVKSVVTRIPDSFEGKGHYIQGDFFQAIPALYQKIRERMGDTDFGPLG